MAADATTVTGTQNPQFRVRVTITPAHPRVGQTVVATFRITNLTARTHRGEWEFTWSTPSSGIGASVSDARGRSHASAKAVFGG